MKEKYRQKNKNRCIPKWVKKLKKKSKNPADINSEWDIGPTSSEVTTTENDCSKPSNSKQSEEMTLISGESKSRATCHLTNKEPSVITAPSNKLCFKSVSSPIIVGKTKNFNLARKLSASAPILLTTSADEEKIFTNSANSSMLYLPFWSRDEFLHSSGDSQCQDTRERERFDIDSSDSENYIKPWYYSNLMAVYSYDNICNHPPIDDIYNPLDLSATESWNYGPVETAASTRNSLTSIKSAGFILSTDVKPHLGIHIMNNTFWNNQPRTSSNTYDDHIRDHMSRRAILKKLFVVEKVNSANVNHPPMEPSDNVNSSKCCDEEDRRSLNKVPHTPCPRLKLLKRAMTMLFRGLLRASKGKCLLKPKKPH